MHSFTSILVHCVWSTKHREPVLNSDLRDRLWPYLGGIARANKMKALAVGGVADHVHMLVSLSGNTLSGQGFAAPQRKLVQMGSRDVSRAALL